MTQLEGSTEDRACPDMQVDTTAMNTLQRNMATPHTVVLTGPSGNGNDLNDFRSFLGSGILPRFFQQSRLEGAPTRRYALSQCHCYYRRSATIKQQAMQHYRQTRQALKQALQSKEPLYPNGD